jgi:hypothetical protein
MPRNIILQCFIFDYKEGFQINVFEKKCPTIYSQIFTVRLQANIYLANLCQMMARSVQR